MPDHPTDAADANPYAPPELGPGARTTDVLQVDSRRFTFREYWQTSRGFATFLLLAIFKLLHVRLRYPFAYPPVDRLDLRDRDRLPPDVLAALGPLEHACEADGLPFGLAYATRVIGPGLEQYVILRRSDDGRILALLTHNRYRLGTDEQVDSQFSAYTRLDGGRWLLTIDQNVWHATAPEFDLRPMPGRPPEEVLAEHRRRLEAPSLAIVPIAADEQPNVPLELDRISRSWYLRGGLFVPMTEAELSRLQRLAGPAPQRRPAHPWLVALVRFYSAFIIVGWLLVVAGLVIIPIAELDEPMPAEHWGIVLGFGLLALITIVCFRRVLGMRRPRHRAEDPRARERRPE